MENSQSEIILFEVTMTLIGLFIGIIAGFLWSLFITKPDTRKTIYTCEGKIIDIIFHYDDDTARHCEDTPCLDLQSNPQITKETA